MNTEMDYLLQGVINSANMNGFNLSNTIFIFCSDHGEMNMEHRQDFKNSPFEGGSRIPLIIAGPNMLKNVVVSNFTELIDILPTLLLFGGASELPGFLNGYSLTPFLYIFFSCRLHVLFSVMFAILNFIFMHAKFRVLTKTPWPFTNYVIYGWKFKKI